MEDAYLLLTTFPDSDSARQIGTSLLEKQLIACITILPASQSLYHWQGAIHQDQEVPALLKTTFSRLEQLESTLIELHSYDTPEFIAIKAEYLSPAYHQWLYDSTNHPLEDH